MLECLITSSFNVYEYGKQSSMINKYSKTVFITNIQY